MIKVLQVIARLNVGGPAVQVVNLAQGLDPARFQVVVLTGRVQGGEDEFLSLRQHELRVIVVPELGRSVRPSKDARALQAVRRELRRLRPDIVHTHTAKAGVVGRIASLTTGVGQRVHTFHGHLLHGYFSPRTTAAVVRTERALARRTHHLVAVGERVRDELLAAGIGCPEQYVVHAPGVSVEPWPSARDARLSLGLPPDGSVVAYVARLTRIKRPDRFLEVAALVSAEEPDVVFLVAGGGPLLDELQHRARAERLPVRFLGWRDDVEAIYAAADVVVLTSDNEGMPVSLIEAAMCGTPAVTVDVGSAAEVVDDGRTGLVTSAAPDDIAAAVLRLLRDDSARADMGRLAASRAQRLFGTDTLVDQTQVLYEAAAQSHHGQES